MPLLQAGMYQMVCPEGKAIFRESNTPFHVEPSGGNRRIPCGVVVTISKVYVKNDWGQYYTWGSLRDDPGYRICVDDLPDGSPSLIPWTEGENDEKGAIMAPFKAGVYRIIDPSGCPIWREGDTEFHVEPFGGANRIPCGAVVAISKVYSKKDWGVRCTWGSLRDQPGYRINVDAFPSGAPRLLPSSVVVNASPTPPAPEDTMEIFKLIGQTELQAASVALAWSTAPKGEPVYAEVQNGNPIYSWICKFWDATKGSNSNNLRKVELISYPDAFILMTSTAKFLHKGRAAGPALNPAAPSSDAFEQGVKKLKSKFLPCKPDGFEHVNFMPTVHGTNCSLAKTIVKSGPHPLRTTDGGFFGAGPYVAFEAEYASRYCKFHAPDACGNYVMILYLAAVGLAYVITRDHDYAANFGPGWSKFYSPDPKKSIALLGNYDAHFVPVAWVDDVYDYQACHARDAKSHELVLSGWQQLCPIALLHFN